MLRITLSQGVYQGHGHCAINPCQIRWRRNHLVVWSAAAAAVAVACNTDVVGRTTTLTGLVAVGAVVVVAAAGCGVDGNVFDLVQVQQIQTGQKTITTSKVGTFRRCNHVPFHSTTAVAL